MDLQTVQLIQRAMPILGRHAAAYVDLAKQDMDVAKRTAIGWVVRGVVLVVSAIFALFCLCVLLIALAWDSEYRVVTIAALTLGFALVAAFCAKSLRRKPKKLFGSLRREWHTDLALLRTLLERLHTHGAEPSRRRYVYGKGLR